MDARVIEKAAPSARKSTNDRSILQIPPAVRLLFQLGWRISPPLGAEIARQLFFRPTRAPYRNDQFARLAVSRQVSLPVRRRHVRAYCWGEGPLVLLLHGWGGHAGQMTEFVMPLTKAGYRVVAIDAPAHGRSAGGLSSIVHFADALEATAGLFGPAHAVIAHSLGAAAASHAMAKGLAVNRAVFVAPQARLTRYWHLFRESLGVSEDAWQRLRTRSERWLKVRYDQLHPIDAAPRMKTPLLILHGEADRMVPLSEGELLARSWPGAEFRALGGGHIAVLRDWRAVIAATAFVTGS